MNDIKPTPKKHVSILVLIVATCILILVGVMAYRKPDSRHTTVAPPDINTIDRLFYDMGVQKIPSVVPPGDILLKDVDGNRVRLSDLKGNIVFLNFWATWCPGCLIEMPSMEKLHNRFKDRDFVMVAISMQEPAVRVKQFLIQNKLSFITLLDTDGHVGSRFGAFSIPTTYILDRDGGVIGKAVGSRDWHSKEAISLFEHLI